MAFLFSAPDHTLEVFSSHAHMISQQRIVSKPNDQVWMSNLMSLCLWFGFAFFFFFPLTLLGQLRFCGQAGRGEKNENYGSK